MISRKEKYVLQKTTPYAEQKNNFYAGFFQLRNTEGRLCWMDNI